jgi:carbon storage regulator
MYQAQNIILARNRRSRMLILTRCQNESIIINDDIKVTVLSDRHGQVKLGIEAPDDIEIWREEIYVLLQESHDE